MKLETVFQFSIYSMTALAGAMLAYGEEIFFPSGVTVILSFLALFINEQTYRFRIPPFVSNLLALVVVGVVISEFRGERADARLLAGAHFLVYVTWIVLFQAKDIRQYWWLCALSLLQVALGPLLTLSSGWYGILLFVYLVLSIWTLSVFTLYQGAIEFGAIAEWTAGRNSGPGIARGSRLVTAPDPLAGLKKIFAGDRRSTVHNSIQQDSPGRWIAPRFVFGVLGLSLSGLALGLAMFLFVPRVWIGGGLRNQNETRGPSPAMTGFSTDVRLGQIGQILESTDRVMHVGLFDHFSDEPLDIDKLVQQQGFSDPLFRGNVLDEYRDGRWLSGNRAERSNTMETWPREQGMIRQEYTLEMRGSDILFAMDPCELAVLTPYQPVNLEVDTNVLFVQDDGRDVVKYLVYSKIREASNGRDVSGGGYADPRRHGHSERSLERCRQLPARGIERLTAFAKELAASDKLAGGEEASRERRIALRLEAHLRDSGTYTYSLNMAVADPQRDPVEDFLFNRQRGHCEYFASALTLMLRAAGIPARLITGFKGADALASAGIYEVQQRHAHAWVEAFVDGRWIVLDPTPASRDEFVREVAARMGFWKNAGNSISTLWSTYVVSLSLNRQQQTLYDPLQGSASNGWGSVRDALTRVVSAAGWVKDAFLSPERLFKPMGAVIFLLLLAAPIFVFKFARRFRKSSRRPRWIRSHRDWIHRFVDWLADRLTGRAPDSARIVVAFYEQFQSLAYAAGFAPRDDQTQREFAHEVEEALVARLAPAGLNRFPSELTEQFYLVRFGEGLLQPAQVAALEDRLKRLKESLLPAGWRVLAVSRLAKADKDH